MKRLLIIVLAFSYFAGSAQPAADKVLHFVAGAAVADASFIAAYKITEDRNKSALIALGSSVFAGLAKEVVDQISYGGFDEKDLLSTAMGGAAISVSFQFVFDEKFRIKMKNDAIPPVIFSENELVDNSEIKKEKEVVEIEANQY